MATKEVSFSIPWPPSVNTYYRSIAIPNGPRKGQVAVLISREGREYRERVIAALLRRFGKVKPVTSRLEYVCTMHAPDRRKRDLSNHLKAFEDALTHAGLWADDSLVDRVTLIRGPVCTPGRLDITLRLLPDDPTLF